MLVEGLIAELQQYDPKLLVITSGYEGGLKEITGTGINRIALNVNSEWYYGKHESVDGFGYRDLSNHTQVDAVYVG